MPVKCGFGLQAEVFHFRASWLEARRPGDRRHVLVSCLKDPARLLAPVEANFPLSSWLRYYGTNCVRCSRLPGKQLRLKRWGGHRADHHVLCSTVEGSAEGNEGKYD